MVIHTHVRAHYAIGMVKIIRVEHTAGPYADKPLVGM